MFLVFESIIIEVPGDQELEAAVPQPSELETPLIGTS